MPFESFSYLTVQRLKLRAKPTDLRGHEAEEGLRWTNDTEKETVASDSGPLPSFDAA